MSGQKHSLGVGLIGSGFMGHTYARAVSTLVEGAHLAGVATGSRAPDLATEYGVPFYDTYEALAASPDVDLVCVGTPHAQHAEHALAAIQAGKHVLIDKPSKHFPNRIEIELHTDAVNLTSASALSKSGSERSG